MLQVNNLQNAQLQGLLSSPAISANAVSNFATRANAVTKGVDIGFSLVDITGVKSITLRRNYLNDLKTATVLQTWDALVSAYTWSDTDAALQTSASAYYWLTLSPTGTTGKAVDIGPQRIVLNPQITPPGEAISISASHGAATNGAVLVTVNVNGIPDTGSIKIYVTGYEGNANPVAVAQQTSSPLQFTLQATGETVTLTAIGVSAGGAEAASGPTTTLVLNGSATVPAQPQSVTIAQIPAGNQITFPSSLDNVTSYQIWRANRGQPFSSATLLHTITGSNVGIIQHLDTGGFSGDYEYFVVAVNAVGSSPPSSPASVNFIAASSVLYIDGQPVQALQPAAPNADVTAAQPIVYTGLSSNLVPNGSFILGNLDNWYVINSAYYSGSPSGALLKVVQAGADAYAISPSFNVIPGQKYRISFTGYQGAAGTQTVTLRIYYGSLYAPNILNTPVPGYIGFANFMTAGSISPTLTTYTYDWTCPAGVYYASLGVIQQGTQQLVFSTISAQDYVAAKEWGADVTGSNTANNTSNVGALTVSGGLNGANGSAIDSSGNVVLKNIGTNTGTAGALTSTFANLPGMGGMSYVLKGNPVLVSASLAFVAASSGGTVTSCGYSPTTASTTTGTGPPNISISISGDGSGASVSISWASSGGPPNFTYTPTLTLTPGSGYTYATSSVIVTVPSGTSYSGSGSGTYGCTVAAPAPQVGVSLSAQVLIDGAILFDPVQGITDGNGRVKFNEMQVFSIASGSHTFAVQAKYDGTIGVKFISGLFNVVELG